jgi:thiamine-phosphate pyrophosphorylase
MTPRFRGVRFIALTDAETFPEFLSQAERLCQRAMPGSVALILRDRGRPVSERAVWGRVLREVTRASEQLFLVSDRVDLARSLDADGVHLPADGLSPVACRQLFPGLITRSGHSLESLNEADFRELSAVLVSPVVAARKGREPLLSRGLAERAEWIRERAPDCGIFALGGVTAEAAPSCLEAGADGVAAIAAAWSPATCDALVDVLGIRQLG